MCQQCEDMCGRNAEARSVLLSVLTPTQAQHYDWFGHFDVDVNGRVYRIHGSGSYNVKLIRDGHLELEHRLHYCAMPNETMPVHYTVLSQLLMLRTNEARFLEIANRQIG